MRQRPAGAPPAEIATVMTDTWTQPYWDAAREHRLVASRCADCGTYRMPPTPFCPKCRSQSTEWPELSGRATVYSYTIIRHPVVPELAETVPYVLAVVALAEAPNARLISNIVECDPETVHIGQEVEVVFDDVNDEVTVPRFAPVDH